MKRIYCFLILTVCLSSFDFAQAAPFAKKFTFTQPDGTQIELWGEGDEFYAVFETLDGYTVVFDPATKAYHYAVVAVNGTSLVPTVLQVGQGDPAALGLVKHLRISPEAIKKQVQDRFQKWDQGMQVTARWNRIKGAWQQATLDAKSGAIMAPPGFTTTGMKAGLCLLVDFSDDQATVPKANIIDFCNSDSYTGYGNNGSVKKYYFDNSNGLLTYTNIVTIYIRVPQPKTYYNDTTKDCGDQGNILIRDAIAAMKALPNYTTDILPAFSGLTVDGSSRVVACNVFYAGGNGGVWSYGLWPHSWSLYNVGAQDLGNGKKVWNYQITNIGASLELGTFCHENGHMLCGYPDIYDYDYDSYGGAGRFCLMGYGGSGGNPVQICAYLKRASGWATTLELASTSNLYATVSSSGAGFNQFYRYAKPGVSTEYYLVENRQKSGRDANLPASGVAIWHIDEFGDHDNQSTNYNSSHLNYEVSLMQADNLWHFQNYVNSGDSKDLYYLGNTAAGYSNTFTDTSAPGARWWDGSNSGVKFTQFSASGSTMTFTVGNPSPAHLVINPASRDYGVLAVGQSSNQTFSVINTGQQTLTGSASVGSPFAIISGGPYSVPGNGTDTVTVGFSPVAAGSFTGAVIFASNGGNSTNTVTGTATTPPPPVADFNGSPTNGVAPLAVTFTNTSTGNITNGFWNFGDGNTTNTTVTSLSHTYGAGTYAVRLTVSGLGGSDTSTRSNYIAVVNPPPPVAGFSGSPTNGVAPLAVTFTNTSTGNITNRFWNLGDGATTNTTATSMSHTYGAAGTYTVSLTVSGLGGSDTSTWSNYIAVVNPPPPVAGFSGSPTNGVAPLAVTFTNTSTGNITNGFWNFGDGNTTNTTVTSLSYAYSTGGTYTVSLTVSGLGGSDTSTRSNYIVVVNPPPPVAGFSGSPTNGVAPLAVTFTNTSTGNITNGFWNFGDGNTTNTTATSLSHMYSAGTYAVRLTVSGFGGSNTNTRSNYIVALTPAHLVISPASRNYGAVTVGQSSNQTFSVINTGQQALTGSAFVGSPFAIISGSSYSVPGNGTDTVTVGFSPVAAGSFTGAVIFASNGGNSTNAVSGVGLTPAQLRVSPASYNFGTLATGTTAQASFVVTNAGGSTLSGTATVGGPPSGGFAVASGSPFNLAGFASTNVAVSFTPPGTGAFSNSVVFASNGGSSTNAVTGSGAIVPVAQFTGSPTNGMAPLVVAFSNLSTGTITDVAWNFGDGHTSTATNPTHTYSNVATFSVSLTVIGPVGSNTLNRSGYITVGNPLAPVITAGPTVTNALLQIGNLPVVAAGDTNVFTVGATDPGGNQLSYRWLFGDGVTNVWSPLSTAQHAYTTNYCGSYTASVTVSNGWTAISTNLTVAVACELTITKMQVKWNFSKTNSDSCSLSATLDLGAGYSVTNKAVMLDIGGAQVPFTLDAKGKGKGVSSFGSCALAYNKKTKRWALTAKLAKGTWRTLWAAYGLVNKTVPKPGVWVTMPVVVLISDEAFADERPMLYTATKDKSGSAK